VLDRAIKFYFSALVPTGAQIFVWGYGKNSGSPPPPPLGFLVRLAAGLFMAEFLLAGTEWRQQFSSTACKPLSSKKVVCGRIGWTSVRISYSFVVCNQVCWYENK